MTNEQIVCRWCGIELNSSAVRTHYGGYVCSYSCDYRSSKQLENSMPGNTPGGNKSLSCYAQKSLNDNWN